MSAQLALIRYIKQIFHDLQDRHCVACYIYADFLFKLLNLSNCWSPGCIFYLLTSRLSQKFVEVTVDRARHKHEACFHEIPLVSYTFTMLYEK